MARDHSMINLLDENFAVRNFAVFVVSVAAKNSQKIRVLIVNRKIYAEHNKNPAFFGTHKKDKMKMEVFGQSRTFQVIIF